MRKNRFFVSGALLVIVLFVFGCGGGGGTDSNGASIGNTKVEKLSLNTDETDFWSDNGSVWREESREVDVFQDGNSSQSELKWGDIFPIQTGDQFNFSFEAEVVGGGEVTFRIVKKEAGKTKIIYSEEKFSFSSGKNTISTLTINATDVRASVVMLFGKKSGRYKFLTNVSVTRTRTTTDVPKITTLDIRKSKFGSDSGSTWNSETGTVTSVMGSQRASTKLEFDEEISLKTNVVCAIVFTGYSLPVGNVVFQFRSSSGQTLAERIVEFSNEELTVEFVPTGTDGKGSLRILFGLSSGTFQLKNIQSKTK